MVAEVRAEALQSQHCKRDNSEALTTLRVVPASRLTPEMLKFNDIVYLGFLSGLGSLRDPVFSGSRFAVGDSYDEIVDRRTGRHYLSGTHLERGQGKLSRDYALVFSFAGVTGNHVVVIAGTRDAALMQGTEFATKAKPLTEVTGPLKGAPAFEALLAIDSLNDEGLRATLLVTAPRPRDADWSGQSPQMFPDDLGGTPPAASSANGQPH